jgi:hypothetical protein
MTREPADLPRSFAYQETDIPAGVTLAQWRRRPGRQRPARRRLRWRSLKAKRR